MTRTYPPLRYWLLGLVLVGQVQAGVRWETTELEIAPKSTETVASVEFRFTNSGTAAVTIQEVRPDCSCVTAPLDQRTYGPGESGRVVIVFNVKGQTGDHHVPIQVISVSEGKVSTEVLILHARIREVVVFSERFLYWRPENELVPRSVTMTLDPKENLTLRDVRSENPAFQVELSATTDPRRFELRVTPPAERGRTFAQIVVTTVSPGNPNPTEHRILARVW